MVPRNDGAEIQRQVLKKVKKVLDTEFECDRMMFQKIFSNFRTGSGLRLSKFGYETCVQNKIYEFFEISLPYREQSSILFTSLDRICTEPYYVLNDKIFLSDRLVVTHYTLCGNSFKSTFEIFS